jgi:hypothetical protein
MKNKKAQVQIFETIAVLVVFFLLIGLGFIFYGRIMQSNLAQEKDEVIQLRAIAVAQRAIFLPEIQCSDDNIIRDSCIDMAKLNAAEQVMKDNPAYYYDFFEFSNITVSEVYPGTQDHTIYQRNTNFRQKSVTYVPVTLYDPATRQNSFGMLKIETYIR